MPDNRKSGIGPRTIHATCSITNLVYSLRANCIVCVCSMSCWPVAVIANIHRLINQFATTQTNQMFTCFERSGTIRNDQERTGVDLGKLRHSPFHSRCESDKLTACVRRRRLISTAPIQ